MSSESWLCPNHFANVNTSQINIKLKLLGSFDIDANRNYLHISKVFFQVKI